MMGGKVGMIILLHLLLAMVKLNVQMEAASTQNDPLIEMVINTQKEINSNMGDHHHHHTHHPMEQASRDPSAMLFFTIKDLKVGNKFEFYMPPKDPLTSSPSLPKEMADSIPFSLKQLPQILTFFSISPGSPQAQVIESSLRQCELEPIKGETKFCGTSMESLKISAQTALGLDLKSSVNHIFTTHLTKSHPHHLQNYTLLQMPYEISAPKFFACHSLSYPYAAHYCHYQEGDNMVLQMPMEGDDGDRVVAAAVCHMDTSEWTPHHPSFKLLKAKPGTIPVCHIFPPYDLILIPMST